MRVRPPGSPREALLIATDRQSVASEIVSGLLADWRVDLNRDCRFVSACRRIDCSHRAICDDSRIRFADRQDRRGRLVRDMPDLLPCFHQPEELSALKPDVDARAVRLAIHLSTQLDTRTLAALSAQDGCTIWNRRATEDREDGLVERLRRRLYR